MSQGIISLLDVHGSFIQAVIDLYPEVVFDQTKFTVLKRTATTCINFCNSPCFVFVGKYPMNDALRRNFFVDFAREQGFDPLVASNWYRFKSETFEKRKVTHYILIHS